ncbi:hypothetical protein EDB86DRAFT_3248279 [Lactarius hatsudake]|nr:hypothetical protein EDB86DRAFT_3248279 [Lactarius hatsudake]
MPDLKVSILPSILPANDLVIDPLRPVFAASPASRRRYNASVAMRDIPSTASDQPVVRRREAEGKRSWGIRVSAQQARTSARIISAATPVISSAFSKFTSRAGVVDSRLTSMDFMVYILMFFCLLDDIAVIVSRLTDVETPRHQAEGRVQATLPHGMAGDAHHLHLHPPMRPPQLLCLLSPRGLAAAGAAVGGARRCVIQALARVEGVPTVGHELDMVAALPAEDEIVRRHAGR